MRVCYVDMVGGAAGDMLLAAFLDAGVDRDALERALRTVVADGWTLSPERVDKRGIAATYAGLIVPGEDGDPQHTHERPHGHEPARTLHDVLDIVARSGLSERQKARAGAVYRRLADAESRVHGSTPETVHFHEIGQLDAILDVAATCVALDLLAVDELRCSPFPIGTGAVGMHHGTYPNPPPATANLMVGWPTRALDVDGELVTPTAAAILTTLATPGRADMVIERIGYGAGRSDFRVPNVTRVIVGTALDDRADRDDVVVIEANIDDMLPQHYELALERVFAAGARDVWMTPIVMKKGRPAITLSAIAALEDEDAVARTILTETTTIGVRVRRERRHVLARTSDDVQTSFGRVRVKRVRADDGERVRPEYDDLLRIARERNLPLPDVARQVDDAIRGMRNG